MVEVDTCWGRRRASDAIYWHVVHVAGFWSETFRNNVLAGNGALLSVAAAIRAEPHLGNAQTGYSLTRMGDAKEGVFEGIRRSEFPERPSRMKSLYVFDSRELADRALREWFPRERRAVHACHILESAVSHRADTQWLNCGESLWEANARNYWSGLMSETPFPEVLVDGALYFEDWEGFGALS